jgi:hypothetical protein
VEGESGAGTGGKTGACIPIHGGREKEVSYISTPSLSFIQLEIMPRNQYAARRLLVLVDLTLALAFKDPELVLKLITDV